MHVIDVALRSAHETTVESVKQYVLYILSGTAVAQWLRCCATIGRSLVRSQLVSLEISVDIKSFRSHYDTGIDSASNRNEYQEYSLVVKAAGA